MRYYSTNHSVEPVTLREAVIKGLAADRGLFMPEVIRHLPASFFDEIQDLSFQEIAYSVADAFFGEDVEADALRKIVYDTLSFDVPLVHVRDNIYSLELFHGPTLAFKDVGARFMARLLQYNLTYQPPLQGGAGSEVNVLVATSGDTGSAVANGFLGVDGIHVYVLYPKGKVSPIQECQFTTLGQNITAIEVDGVFDDCQALVKSAFMDAELNQHMMLTSANSINVARFLPQSFYYFYAYAQLKRLSKSNPAIDLSQLVCCVPSGNFGNICSALFGHAMGLPVKRFIAANNANDVFYQYLQTGQYIPRPSIQTLANAMDVGDPSNFARILDLYARSVVGILSAPLAPVPGGSPASSSSAPSGPVLGGSLASSSSAPSGPVLGGSLASSSSVPSGPVLGGSLASSSSVPSGPVLGGLSAEASTIAVIPSADPRAVHSAIISLISGATYTDDQIASAMRQCYAETGYLLDPHGACGYLALTEQLKPGETGFFLETAHPAKFKDTVDRILSADGKPSDIAIPDRLAAFMQGTKQSIPMSRNFADFKQFLLSR